MNWRDSGDVTFENWVKELQRYNSPILKEARETYEAAKGLSRLLLFISELESRHQTLFNLNVPGNMNPLNLKPRGLGGWAKFESYADAFAEAKARLLDPKYAYSKTETLADLIHVYAPSYDNNNEAAYVRFIEAGFDRVPAIEEGEETDVATKRIILNMGHRDTTGGGTAGGNLTERGYTDDIVLACERRLKQAGWEVFVVQRYDNDPDDTMLNKNLDWVGKTAVSIDKHLGPVAAYLSIHLEGSQARGVFAIVPDSRGLTAFATQRPDPGDEWTNNPLDVTFARALAKHCSRTTGLPLRQTTEPGVMSERSTGVGGSGWRLSEFHETMPIRAHATRNILECGALPNALDRAIISRTDFPDLIAQGVTAAAEEVFGKATPAPDPKPEPEPTPFFSDEEWELLWGDSRRYNKKGRIETTWREWCIKNGMYPPFVTYRNLREGGRDYLFANGLIIRYQDRKVTVLKK